jgi:hypothetical protein
MWPTAAIGTGSTTVTYAPFPSHWGVKRVYGTDHRWQWFAYGPKGSLAGGALSEAVARSRALRAFEQVGGRGS